MGSREEILAVQVGDVRLGSKLAFLVCSSLIINKSGPISCLLRDHCGLESYV